MSSSDDDEDEDDDIYLLFLATSLLNLKIGFLGLCNNSLILDFYSNTYLICSKF